MKKLIIGVGIFICGIIFLCTDWIITRIIDAMPGVSLTGGGMFSLSFLACLLCLGGAVLAIWGLGEE